MDHGRATPPRRAALGVMRAVRTGDLADRALERYADSLEPRDRAWTQELVYGTFRLRGRIDHVLTPRVRGGLERLDADVLDVLRLGVYQLLEMGSVPAYAAVSQSVELARDAGHPRAAGLVNGVLQAVRREAASVRFPEFQRDPVGHLSSWGSHPAWLLERWLRRWGGEETAALVEANNQRPELYLTLLGPAAPDAVNRLAEAGIPAEPVPAAPDSVRLGAGAAPSEALSRVPSVVQDPAAALVVRYAAVPAGATVLDLCAAPGGKALALAAAGARVVASDLSVRRLRRLRNNVERVGYADRVALVAADGRTPPFQPADAVLLDAPCLGTGTLRRHPDGRWKVHPDQLGSLVALQRELLAAAARLVLPNGLLIYSTCSLEPEENEDQVRWFLEEYPNYVLEPPPAAVDASLLAPDGCLQVLPQRHGFDGSFAARLRRVDGIET